MISLMEWLPECPELAGIKVNNLTIDSREVSKGTVFVALKGLSFDGHNYIEDAIKSGAVAIISERPISIGHQVVPICVVDNLKERLGELAHEFFGGVTNDLKMIGITGTNGKTSTCQYIAQALDFLGKRCGIIGTNGQGLWGQLSETLNTTPDVVRLHNELSRQKEQGATYCAMEVSSHGVDQGRINGVVFSTAVFTNLTRDHLDYHETMQSYGNAKWRLMNWPNLKNAVINIDDEWVRGHRDSITAENIMTYSVHQEADVQAQSIRLHEAGIDAKVKTKDGVVDLNLRLLGLFNLSNALAALCVLLVEGIPLNTAARVISNTHAVKGRMETFRLHRAPTVVIDYAHTSDALAKALQGCRDHVSGRLGVIFGCGGDRDQGKRSEMAKIAETYADFIVVTDDNPRSESSNSIIADICSGFSEEAKKTIKVISDRENAITQTLAECGTEDVILIAGKGHEAYQEIMGVRHQFSDQETVINWQELNDVD